MNTFNKGSNLILYLIMFLILSLGSSPASARNKVTKDANISLMSLLKFAEANNPNISYGVNGVNVESENVEFRKQQFLPTPSVSLSQDSKNRQTVNASLKQPIWTGGKLTSDLESSIHKLEASSYNLDEIKLNTYIAIIQEWQRWLVAKKKIKVTDETNEIYKKYRLLILNRIAGGRSSQSDLNLIESRITQTNFERNQLLIDYNSSASRLSLLIGKEINPEMISDLVNVTPHARSFDKDLEMAINNSPSILKATKEAEVLMSEAKSAKAILYPEISLVATTDKLGNYSPDGNRIMLTVSLTPGPGFSSLTAYQVSELKSIQAKDKINDTRTKLSSQLRDIVIRLNSGVEDSSLVLLRIQENEKIVSSYKKQFDFGQKSWNDLVNAIRELSFSRLAYVDRESQLLSDELQFQMYMSGPNLKVFEW